MSLSSQCLSNKLWPSVLWRCWLGVRKGIRTVKTEWWGAGVVICLKLGADLHMPNWCNCHSLSLASVKSRLVLPFWYRLTRVVPEKGPLNGCVCVYLINQNFTKSRNSYKQEVKFDFNADLTGNQRPIITVTNKFKGLYECRLRGVWHLHP